MDQRLLDLGIPIYHGTLHDYVDETDLKLTFGPERFRAFERFLRNPEYNGYGQLYSVNEVLEFLDEDYLKIDE